MLLAALAPLLTLLLLPRQTSNGAAEPPAALSRAASLLAGNHVVEARALFESVLVRDPANAEAQEGEVDACERLALDARARGENDDALRTLLAAERFAPSNPRLLFDLGVQEDSMKLFWDADKAVVRLQALPGGTAPQVLYLAARIKMNLGQLGPAEEQMRAYLKTNPDDATAHYGLGRILQLGQNAEGARGEFLRSLALQPHQTESHFQLGEIALEQARYEDAIAEYAKTLEGNAEHGGALAGTGTAWFRLKQYEKAAVALERAVAAAPSYQPGHYYLGLTLARMGRKAESDQELARAAAMATAANQLSGQRLRLGGAGAPPPAQQP